MKSGNWKIVPALGALVLTTMFAPPRPRRLRPLSSSAARRQLAAPDRLAAAGTRGFHH